MMKMQMNISTIIVVVLFFVGILISSYVSEVYLFAIGQLLGIFYALNLIRRNCRSINLLFKLIGLFSVLLVCLEVWYIQRNILPYFFQIDGIFSFLLGVTPPITISFSLCRILNFYDVKIKRYWENQLKIKSLIHTHITAPPLLKQLKTSDFGVENFISLNLLKLVQIVGIVLICFVSIFLVLMLESKSKNEIILMTFKVSKFSIFYSETDRDLDLRHRKPHIIRIDQMSRKYLDDELIIDDKTLHLKLMQINRLEAFPRIEIYPNDRAKLKDFFDVMRSIKKSEVKDFCLICIKSTLLEETPEETKRLDELKLQNHLITL